MKLSTIDIGSNTVRLLIAQKTVKGWKRLLMLHRVTRLSGGFDGNLQEDRISKTIEIIAEFANCAKENDALPVSAVCTGVTRKAKNADSFLKRVKSYSKVSPEVISGNEEARLTAKGAAMLLRFIDAPFLLFDIGGFSTEVIYVDKGRAKKTVSMELGAVRLTEELMSAPLPTDSDVRKVDKAVKNLIVKRASGIIGNNFPSKYLVATAGTATSLAAMDLGLERYVSEKVEGHILTLENLKRLFEKIVKSTPEDRLKEFPSLEKGREDVLPAGIIICLQMMDIFRFKKILVTEGGLLEGLLEKDFPLNGRKLR